MKVVGPEDSFAELLKLGPRPDEAITRELHHEFLLVWRTAKVS